MKIQVCVGRKCKGNFSEFILKRLKADIEKFWLQNITLETIPCQNHCENGPNVIVDGKIHHKCDPIKVAKMLPKQ